MFLDRDGDLTYLVGRRFCDNQFEGISVTFSQIG